MYVVLLKFSGNKSKAPDLMDGHNVWIREGFEAGVFLAAGSLQPNAGGGILAHGTTREALDARIAADPFVAAGVVTADVLEITPARTDPRLDFLKA
ncbi:YciI family protein [Hyphomonas jannaschiana]|uniref:YciI family protein n=1 Tax=Hyphomonas jannaschiana TaxID=86 RepID=UPI0035C66397